MGMSYKIAHITPADWPQIQLLLQQAMDFTTKKNYPIYPGHDQEQRLFTGKN